MSGLRLIDEDERLAFEGDGFKIYYRRIDNQRRAQLADKYTKRGETNLAALSLAILEFCILGWDGVHRIEDGKKVAIPFETSLVKYLPDEIAGKIVDLIGANADLKEAELGN